MRKDLKIFLLNVLAINILTGFFTTVLTCLVMFILWQPEVPWPFTRISLVAWLTFFTALFLTNPLITKENVDK